MSDPLLSFDINNPDLPTAIDKAVLGSGGFPYGKKLDRDEYDTQIYALQKELVKLQSHMQTKGERIVLVFEGRHLCLVAIVEVV